MTEVIDPLDPTGLSFVDGKHGHGYREFTVSGFRDQSHAQAWADAYYKRAWGYGPRTTVNNCTVNVKERTSCD